MDKKLKNQTILITTIFLIAYFTFKYFNEKKRVTKIDDVIGLWESDYKNNKIYLNFQKDGITYKNRNSETPIMNFSFEKNKVFVFGSNDTLKWEVF